MTTVKILRGGTEQGLEQEINQYLAEYSTEGRFDVVLHYQANAWYDSDEKESTYWYTCLVQLTFYKEG